MNRSSQGRELYGIFIACKKRVEKEKFSNYATDSKDYSIKNVLKYLFTFYQNNRTYNV